ncbi:MAG TPA: MFS transporter [Propionibacteriaceae bacterium]|nr:MFS transporter [Propionibacteriaceae bacterium]
MATVTTAPPSTGGSTAGQSLTRWRAALVTVFFGAGIAVASWVTRTPAIRDALHASTAEMGLIIGGSSVGSIVGISLGSPLVARRGARFVIVTGMSCVALGLSVMALGVVVTHAVVVALGLAMFGYGMGTGEIGNNVSGVELEARMGRSVIPGLHGSYSLGTVIGGVAGLAANRWALPVAAHLLVAAAAIAGAAIFWVSRQVRPDTGRVHRTPAATVPPQALPGSAPAPVARQPRFRWLDRRLVGLAVIILGMALAEGSANDWLPLIVVDGYGSNAAVGSIVFSFFGLAMAVGRLGGGGAIDRFGRAPVMRVSAVVAAIGIVTVIVAPTLWVAGAGVLLWGVGCALGFPVALSAAGENSRFAAQRAGFVATAGYAAFLVGPPVLGFLGQHIGIRHAIVVVLAVVLVTVFVAGAARPAPAERAGAAHDAAPEAA